MSETEEIETLIAGITPDVYQRLATAVETGKWANGVPLTPAHKAYSLQLVLLWQSRHNSNPQHMSIGRDGHIVIKGKPQ